MPPRSHPKPQPLSQLQRMLQVATRAPLSLSQNNQPHALLPSGNCAPLASEPYYSWISHALADQGITPGAAQLGHLIRQLDAQAHNTQTYQHVHLRALKTEPKTYKFHLAHQPFTIISLTEKGWEISLDFDTRFYHPDSAIPLLEPEPVKTKFHHCLEKLFHLETETAKKLTTWMVQALLPDQTPPALIITGNARQQAAEKLRNLIDPVICPIQSLPATARQITRQALVNRIMVYATDTPLSKNCIAALNELRTGTIVELRQVNKRRDPLSTRIQRPIIIAVAEAPEIHTDQLVIEINEAETIDRAHALASLLDAAVHTLATIKERQPEIIELQLAFPHQLPHVDDADTPGPVP